MRRNVTSGVKKAAALTLALLLSVFGLSACTGETERTVEGPELLEPVGVVLDTEVVKKGEIAEVLTYTGIVAAEEIELYFDIDGTVEEVYVYNGQYVNAGDPLIKLDQEAVLTQIETLEKRIASTEKNGSYEDQIADLNIQYLQLELQQIANTMGTDNQAYRLKALEIEDAQLSKNQKIETRNISLSDMRTQLQDLQKKAEGQLLTAPVSGHVKLPGDMEAGSWARALRTVVTITDPSAISFKVTDSVNDVIFDNGSYYGWIGGKRWDLIYKELTQDEKQRYMQQGERAPSIFSFKDDAAAKKELYAGMNGALLGDLWRVSDTISVPADSVYREGFISYVYVLENGSRVRKEVKTGYTNGIRTVIKSGLEEGDEVYVQE